MMQHLYSLTGNISPSEINSISIQVLFPSYMNIQAENLPRVQRGAWMHSKASTSVDWGTKWIEFILHAKFYMTVH